MDLPCGRGAVRRVHAEAARYPCEGIAAAGDVACRPRALTDLRVFDGWKSDAA